MANQLANIPDRICPRTLPHFDLELIQQYKNDGTSNYTIDLMLESDPAALQALLYIRVSIDRYRNYFISPNPFVSKFCDFIIHINHSF